MTVSAIEAESGALSSLRQYRLGEMPNWIEIVDLR
jgi:hypothetical protein